MSDETQVPATPAEQAQKSEESRVMARRFFIKSAIYAAPIVASVVSVQHASAQLSCCPTCLPTGDPSCNLPPLNC